MRVNMSAQGSALQIYQQVGEVSIDNGSSSDMINTQHNEASKTNHDASVPSVTFLNVIENETSFDTYSNCNRRKLNEHTAQNLSAQNTTADVTVKVAAVNSQRNLSTKPALMTASIANAGKNFAGLEEIKDENSAKVGHEVSNGKWSSDIQDETLTLNTSTYRGEKTMMTANYTKNQPATSAFAE